MKTLKYIVVLGIFFLIACRPEIEKPDDVLPIDWDNYNDVYTVYWNYRSKKCSTKTGTTGKTIKVSGWVLKNSILIHGGICHYFFLVDYPDRVPENRYGGSITIEVNTYYIGEEIKTMLDTCDFTKKCFIKGELMLGDMQEAPHCSIVPGIILHSIDDIYFETDKIDSDE